MVEIDESNIGNYLSRDCNDTVLGENELSDLQAIKDGSAEGGGNVMICDAGIRELGRKGEEIGEMVEIDESNIGNYLSRDCNYTVLGENGLSDLQAIKDGISNPMEMNGFQALKPSN
ncbi:hypothetical protein V6N11_000948 [Hibiscus sabdariffa]|uniref:Uncharacterized protein n=1 Tax=Hibiscus sabdariffa TaxID=183260 RepID=A0ABR2RYJ4_9ROSI